MKTYGTTNLINHLKGKHPDSFGEFHKKEEELKLAASAGVAKKWQLSLQECEDRGHCWDINDARAKRIHKRVGEMIALDYHLFSVVEDEGFIRLLKELEPQCSLLS